MATPCPLRGYVMEDQKFLRRSICYFGMHGFHGRTISEICNVTLWSVYHTLKHAGIRLRAYRDGENEIAERVISRNPARQHHFHPMAKRLVGSRG
jgi:hypothetical protein